jgi:hypothetical protein
MQGNTLMETQDFWMGEDVIRSAGREGYTSRTKCVLIKVPVQCLICRAKVNISGEYGSSNQSDFFVGLCEHFACWKGVWEQAKTVNPDLCMQCLQEH